MPAGLMVGDDACMELDLGDGVLSDAFPDNFLIDDDQFEMIHQEQLPPVTLREQLVKFDVRRGEEQPFTHQPPLRHTSSGAASRHCALPPQLSTMRRSHTGADLQVMAEAASSTQQTLMRRSVSDSMLADRMFPKRAKVR
jgi:hypothetical protein